MRDFKQKLETLQSDIESQLILTRLTQKPKVKAFLEHCASILNEAGLSNKQKYIAILKLLQTLHNNTSQLSFRLFGSFVGSQSLLRIKTAAILSSHLEFNPENDPDYQEKLQRESDAATRSATAERQYAIYKAVNSARNDWKAEYGVFNPEEDAGLDWQTSFSIDRKKQERIDRRTGPALFKAQKHMISNAIKSLEHQTDSAVEMVSNADAAKTPTMFAKH